MMACPVAAKFSSPLKQCSYLIKKISNTYDNTKPLCGERKFAPTTELTQNEAAMVACPVAAKSSSPLKQCSHLIKKISNTYSNTTPLCGERKFATTRELNQNAAAMVACPRGGEVLFAVKTMFLPYKKISAMPTAIPGDCAAKGNFAATGDYFLGFLLKR